MKFETYIKDKYCYVGSIFVQSNQVGLKFVNNLLTVYVRDTDIFLSTNIQAKLVVILKQRHSFYSFVLSETRNSTHNQFGIRAVN